MRKLLLIAAVAVVVLIVVAVVVVLNLGRLIEAGVERGGRLVLGVETELDDASASLLGGSVGLDGLTIGSPEGFEAPAMFELGHAHAKVDLGSLRSDEIVIHEVVVDGAQVTLELAGGKTNWGVLMDRLEREPTREEQKKASQRKLRVERIVFTNGKVKIAGIPVAATAGVPLPGLTITDLRTGEGKAATARTVLAQVVRQLREAVLAAAGDVIPAGEIRKLGGDVQDLLEGGTGAVGEQAHKAGEKASGLLKDVLGGEEQ